MLRAVIAAERPRRIVEIGSGFSTACMLDSLDHFGLKQTRITCIEPFSARLRSVLRPGDEARVEIIERPVQGMALETFARLEANDILFIDSTHVLKTGSDVHYELFHILPVLKTGVLVHFHDCRYPFEYPAEFIFERNYSWNEAYALRAFLMYNAKFRVFFYNSLFARRFRDLAAAACPAFLRNPGSSIWLKVNPQ
jgi:predicted O-methyltransferase YrrM